MSIYLDSAYVAKCYVNEPDSQEVRALVRSQSAIHSSAWCLAEVACVFHRHSRERGLTKREAAEIQAGFLADLEKGVWTLVPVSEALLRRIGEFLRKVPNEVRIRAGDAVHLISAREAGFSEIWSNDRHLLNAARHFGLRGRTA